MGCCLAKDPIDFEEDTTLGASLDPIDVKEGTIESLDPLLTRFNELFIKGDQCDVISTIDITIIMGIPAITMGRMVTQWGYGHSRKYIDGKRMRVVVGIRRV